MNPTALQNFCQYGASICSILVVLFGLGIFYFGNKAQDIKDQQKTRFHKRLHTDSKVDMEKNHGEVIKVLTNEIKKTQDGIQEIKNILLQQVIQKSSSWTEINITNKLPINATEALLSFQLENGMVEGLVQIMGLQEVKYFKISSKEETEMKIKLHSRKNLNHRHILLYKITKTQDARNLSIGIKGFSYER